MTSLANRSQGDGVPDNIARFIVAGVRDADVELEALLRKAELSHLLVDQPVDAYIPTLQFLPVYRYCAVALGKKVFTADSEIIRPTFEDCELLCLCIINCSNLGDVINKSGKFLKALNGRAETITLKEVGEYAVLTVNVLKGGQEFSHGVIDLWSLIYFYKLFSWLIAEPLQAKNVTVAHDRIIDKFLDNIFYCPINFCEQSNSIIFKKELLARPVVRSYCDLVVALEASPFILAPLQKNTGISSRLENMFRNALLKHNPLPCVDQVAAVMGKSAPTLRRLLARENVSFQYLADKCRMEMAKDLLANHSLSIDEISFLLGFSASSSFSRAFKDWTTHNPTAYRRMANNH